MSDGSAIEWTDATWNPTVGCSVLTPGCTNCYAMKLAGRLEAMGSPIYQGHTTKTKAGFVWNGKVSLSNWGQLIKPLSWKKPRRIFVNSMSDLFHEALSATDVAQIFAVMALCPQHTFQVLSKRAQRMRDWSLLGDIAIHVHRASENLRIECGLPVTLNHSYYWPLPNVWLGVSVEDQPRADERIPLLLETPAAVRFLSCEPLLGPVDLENVAFGPGQHDDPDISIDALDGKRWFAGLGGASQDIGKIDWVIVGGESGKNARPMRPDWARSLRDQCDSAGVPFFFKQWGEWIGADDWLSVLDRDGFQFRCPGDRSPQRPLNFADAAGLAGIAGDAFEHQSDGTTLIRVGKKRAGRVFDGREWNEFPKVPA